MAAFDAGEYSKAATGLAKLAEAREKAERAATGRPGPHTATALLELSWYRLFAHDFRGSLAASERAIAAQPDFLPAVMNRAHALMFLGRDREARALYARYKGQDVKGYGQWEAVVLGDFKEFEKRGLKNRQIAEIKALLAPKSEAGACGQAHGRSCGVRVYLISIKDLAHTAAAATRAKSRQTGHGGLFLCAKPRHGRHCVLLKTQAKMI